MSHLSHKGTETLFFPNSPKLEASAQSQARPDQAKEKAAAAELGNG